MPYASTLPSLLNDLGDALRARPGLNGVAVSTVEPGPDRTEAEHIIFFGADAAEGQEPYALGGTRFEEVYDLGGSIEIAVSGGEDEMVTARERAFAIYSEITTLLVEQPSLGRVDIRFTHHTWSQFRQVSDGQGRWLATVVFLLRAYGRIDS